jgi:hypothetical protein
MRPVLNSWSSARKAKLLLLNHPQLYLWCHIIDVFEDKGRTDTQNKFFETVVVSKRYESDISVRQFYTKRPKHEISNTPYY